MTLRTLYMQTVIEIFQCNASRVPIVTEFSVDVVNEEIDAAIASANAELKAMENYRDPQLKVKRPSSYEIYDVRLQNLHHITRSSNALIDRTGLRNLLLTKSLFVTRKQTFCVASWDVLIDPDFFLQLCHGRTHIVHLMP